MRKALVALQRRLETDTLTPEDRERFDLARKLRELRREGLSMRAIAERLGKGESGLTQFMRRGVFAVFNGYLQGLEKGEDEVACDEVVRKARVDFRALAPDAIEYYRSCYARDAEGAWKDDAKAMWATERVGRGLGLTEPDIAARPVIQINIAHIRAEAAEVAEDDALARDAIDVTPELEAKAS